MWKRANRTGDRAIGHPTLIETTVDERTLEGLTLLNTGDFSISSRPAFGRKKTQDVLKGLPELPLSLQASNTQSTRPFSETPTASSVYSQPSPDLNNEPTTNLDTSRASSGCSADVSPPESIRMDDSAPNMSRRGSCDVSPITESSNPLASHLAKSGNFGSCISVPPKRYKLRGTGAVFSEWGGGDFSTSPPGRGSAQAALTRWDDFSGEPTTSETGKPAQATPRATSFQSEVSARHSMGAYGNTTTISGGSSQGMRRCPNKQTDPAFTPKEGWRSASGRRTSVNPMLDKPLPPCKSPTFPHDTQKDSANLLETSSGRNSPASTIVQFVHRKPIQPPKLLINDNSMGSLNDGKSKTLETGPPTALPSSTNLVRSNIEITGSTSLATRKANADSQCIRLLASPDVIPNGVANGHNLDLIESDFLAKMHHMHFEDQPPSRFSATTYATTAYDSPPATPEMSSVSPIASPSSILNRKRPVPLAGVPNSRLPTRKPTPSELSKSFHADEDGRFSKSLPKSPPEAQAVTRVASLEAKLDNLRCRRANLKTVIHELTYVVQPNSIAYDKASRQEIKRTVDGLDKELAEVAKEEHETGLQLYRAWKRQDNDSAYEHSSLWVKRLAS
ncbi:hypothetical protein MMC07_007315 [Pseudocyphellaria aurata]|nr:hypothetical protein [Pseudocyphellaria aurata]